MRFLTRLAVCVASLLITTRGAEAGPIQASDAILYDYAEPAHWLPVSPADHDIPDFRDQLEWLSFYGVKAGKAGRVPYLVEWNDYVVFLIPLTQSAIAWKWQSPRTPGKEQPAGVPEPSTLLLCGLGAAAFVRRRRPLR